MIDLDSISVDPVVTKSWLGETAFQSLRFVSRSVPGAERIGARARILRPAGRRTSTSMGTLTRWWSRPVRRCRSTMS